jgi:hypothetical protein
MAAGDWKIKDYDRTRSGYPVRMANYTAEQQEFFKAWSSKCYDYNGGLLFYQDTPDHGIATAWSLVSLQGIWEDLMAWQPTDSMLAVMTLHDRPSIRCGALAWLATRGSCPDKDYPNFWGDHRDSNRPYYLVEAEHYATA